MEQSVTLTDAVGNALIPFEVDGHKFNIRQPTAEEYDDALSLQRMVYQKTLQMPHVQAVADMPCSDNERSLFEAMIESTKEKFEAAEDGPNKRALAEELARLQNELNERTLAEETASDAASLKRDRWLCMYLLCDEHGKPLFNTKAKNFEAAWNKLPIKVKNEARPYIWQALALVREAPFSSEL